MTSHGLESHTLGKSSLTGAPAPGDLKLPPNLEREVARSMVSNVVWAPSRRLVACLEGTSSKCEKDSLFLLYTNGRDSFAPPSSCPTVSWRHLSCYRPSVVEIPEGKTLQRDMQPDMAHVSLSEDP